jgi:cysteine desulfurase
MRVNGHPEGRLPNTLSVSFRGRDAQALLRGIGHRVAASAGAACHSGLVEISHVLQAMRVPLEWAQGTLRLSTGRMSTLLDIEEAIDAITCVVADSDKG